MAPDTGRQEGVEKVDSLEPPGGKEELRSRRWVRAEEHRQPTKVFDVLQ